MKVRYTREKDGSVTSHFPDDKKHSVPFFMSSPYSIFSSVNSKIISYEDSFKRPSIYYRFRLFSVLICVHRINGFFDKEKNLPRDDYYFIMSSERHENAPIFARKGQVNLYCPTTSFEAIIDTFFVFVSEYLRSKGLYSELQQSLFQKSNRLQDA